MVEFEQMQRPPLRVADDVGDDEQNVVSTGETSAGEQDDDDDMFSTTDGESDDNRNGKEEMAANTKRDYKAEDLFYDENLDVEDEAYVYKNMRGGIKESVTVNTKSERTPLSVSIGGESSDNSTGGADNSAKRKETYRQQAVEMFKPRHSDAVLSCPCCFNIVCMDCQKHKRYANQYRAMFVMGIVVDWSHILVYDKTHHLVTKAEPDVEQASNLATTNEEPLLDDNNQRLRTKPGEYYAVECAACRTQVAALDMTEEVYYFYGCLESSSAF